MSQGQWRTLALLGLLLGLEIIRSPTLQTFFKSILAHPVQSQGSTVVPTVKGTPTPTRTSSGISTGGTAMQARIVQSRNIA